MRCVLDYLSLCLICKDENEYLPEWLDYHILVGVDRFYIYDNRSQTSLRTTLADYIARGWVAVIDFPGSGMQLQAYDHCLQFMGPHTRWLGFIDTDEFFVPKTSVSLSELLHEYEAYAGLAVSTYFFGSCGHRERPESGQLVGYTRRTESAFSRNMLVKSIVQPERVVFPASPHDFFYRENSWCVNEQFLRVDNQRFPHFSDKIQLNHYYCRSAAEIEKKLLRGNSGDVQWPRKRFELVNRLATENDDFVLQKLAGICRNNQIAWGEQEEEAEPGRLLDAMARLARTRMPEAWEFVPPGNGNGRAEMVNFEGLSNQIAEAEGRGDYRECARVTLQKIECAPESPILYVDLAICFLNLKDPVQAWQALARSWKMAPNSYAVLLGMAYYFLQVQDFAQAKQTTHLLLGLAPQDLIGLAFLAEALIGLDQWDKALEIGVAVIEMAAFYQLDLPAGTGVPLLKKLSDYALTHKQFPIIVRLREAETAAKEGDVLALRINLLLLQGSSMPGATKLLGGRLG